MNIVLRSSLVLLWVLSAGLGRAQTAPNITALRGLAAFAVLPNTPEGQAALAANLSITGAIQTGKLSQPLLLPFAEQQQQALADCFITDGNGTGLADGLGTTLAAAYRQKARYDDPKSFTSLAPSLAALIAYTNSITRADSGAAKYFFANATTNGSTPVSDTAAAIFRGTGGTTDVLGHVYGRPAGSQGSDAYGNPRPFQTEQLLIAFRGIDYFGQPTSSLDWLRGPNQNLMNSPSYPSGHTTYGYAEAVLFGLLVPERYQQMIARAAEYGNDRIIVGAHYTMDVLGGRATALHALAHLLAEDPTYVGETRPGDAAGAMGRPPPQAVALANYRAAVQAARADLDAVLQKACGNTIATCAAADRGRFKDPAANRDLYEATQTYGLPVVHPAGKTEDVGRLAPEAGYLLTAAFPTISLDEADAILTATEGPGGGFLDDGSSFGVYSRIDLYAAVGRAAAAKK